MEKTFTVQDYKSLDPNRVWVFQADTLAECENIAEGLHSMELQCEHLIPIIIMPNDVSVKEISIEELEQILKEAKEGRELSNGQS